MIRLVQRLCRIFRKEQSLEEIARKLMPNRFYRGLSSEVDFTPEGYIAASAFEFKDHTNERNDGFWETSINWDDDNESVTTLMAQRNSKSNKLMFDRYSYIKKSQLKNSLALPLREGHFKYERRPLPNNQYHGNLLAQGDLDKKTKGLIKSTLAMVATKNLKNIKML